MPNKNARINKMSIKSLQFLRQKQVRNCIGWGLKLQFAKLVGRGGGGTIYMFKQISMVDTGNVNADFKLLTHNPYSVLNRLIVCQIHPSSLTTFCMQHSSNDYTVKGQASNLGVLGMSSKFQFIMTFSEKKRVMTKVCISF